MHPTRALLRSTLSTALVAAACGDSGGGPSLTGTPGSTFPPSGGSNDPSGSDDPAEPSGASAPTEDPGMSAPTEASATDGASAPTTAGATEDPSTESGDTSESETGPPPVLVCDGFELAAADWSLVELGADVEVLDDTLHDSDFGCADTGQQLTFSLLDLTGDGRPDLVQTDACDAAGVGTDTWRVFAAGDHGFAASGAAWSLPDLGATAEVLDDMFHDSDIGCADTGQQLTFSLLDLVGDARPDLVVTDACDAAGVGTTGWKVHEATDAGFADQPKAWSLPNLGATSEVLDDTFHDSDIGCADTSQQLTFSLLDLTGDGRVDLVQTDACDVEGVGTDEWRVFAAGAAGFGAATAWSLPDLGATAEVLDDTFHDSDIGCADTGQQLTFSLLDLAGDARPDLVVTDACDAAGVGTVGWQVHEAADGGFAAQATAWSLPDLGTDVEVLDDMFHDSDIGCSDASQQLTFSLLDLTGDGRVDLVQTDACDVEGVGVDTWRVFAGGAAGFAAAGAAWALPGLGADVEVLDDTFHDSDFGCADASQQLTLSLLDLTGDGVVDLVQTDGCDEAGVGTSVWRLYAAACAAG